MDVEKSVSSSEMDSLQIGSEGESIENKNRAGSDENYISLVVCYSYRHKWSIDAVVNK